MNKTILFGILFFFILPLAVLSADQKPLEPEQVLKLRNYELGLQNLQLQIEILNREIQKLKQERNLYLDELYKNYGFDKKWKIDLEKGIWFVEEAPDAGKAQED